MSGYLLLVSPAMACCCMLPTCTSCMAAPALSQGRQTLASSQGQRVVDEARVVSQVGEAPVVVSECSCLLPGCRHCSSLVSSQGQPVDPKPQKKARPQTKARRQRTVGVKRPLSQELAEDSGEDSGPDSWLRVIRLPASREKQRARRRAVRDASPGPWEFWELWSGCGKFTAAVMRAGGRAGPSVDILPCASVPRLPLDLEDDGDVEFLWWLLHEFRPRFVHVGPPCTFWGQLGRMTAVRTLAEWAMRVIRSC